MTSHPDLPVLTGDPPEGGEVRPETLEAVARVRGVLVEGGHPVLDVLVSLTPHAEGDLLRVEFRYAGRRVGVLRTRARSKLARVTAVVPDLPSPWTETSSTPARLREVLSTLPPGAAGDGEDERDLASNDDLRALREVPPAERRAARDAIRREFAVPSEGLVRVLHLLALDELAGTVVANREEAAATRLFLDDLASGTPLGWALRRVAAASGSRGRSGR